MTYRKEQIHEKKITILLIMLIVSVSAYSEEIGFVLSDLSTEELLLLQDEINKELFDRQGKTILPSGEYVVGRDIAAGLYIVTPFTQNKEYTGKTWGIKVWNSPQAKMKLYDERVVYLKAKYNSSSEDEAPKDPNSSDYLVSNNYHTNSETQMVSLEEGQMLEVEYTNDDITLVLTVEKTKGLFMD